MRRRDRGRERTSFEQIVAGLRTADEPLEPDAQRCALMLLRPLAGGAPVSVATLAERHVGLAVTEFGPHRYRIDGRQLFTWCAWDPFILTDWLAGTADVSSVDAPTGEPDEFRIEDERVMELPRPGLVDHDPRD